MLPASSVRALVPSWASVAPLAVFAPSLARCHHQRRCSSSKSSRPDNDPSDVSPGHSVATSSTSARGDGKKKRKIKDVLANKLPSVPTTQHMSEEALGLSRFFSLYRPISITQTMPQTVTHEYFASIFAPQSKAKKHADTVSTLSKTIDRLDSPIKQMPTGMQVDDATISDAAASTENSEGAKLISLHIETMGGDFLPFRPPPLPRPQSADEAELVPETPQHRVYKAMFIIEETTEPSGQVRVLAHSPRIYDGPRSSFFGRMAGRQAHFNESNAVRRDMHAISVRRQRKLRMKKKKYKKLMKRTRNARRKLDRT